MNASEIRQKFNSFDKAVTEIERLQNPSNSSSAQTERQTRIRHTLGNLIPPPGEHGMPLINDTLAKVSRPLTEAPQFANWCK
jgi:hypothetical protein